MAQQLDHVFSVMGRHIQQQAFLAKALADGPHQGRQVHVIGIDLVDDDHAAQPALAGQVKHALGGQLDAGLRVDNHQRRVHAGQSRNGLPGKVGVTRGVDQVNLRTVPLQRGQRGLQRMAELFFHGVKVAGGIALLDRTPAGNGARGREQAFRQGGLAGCSVADQGNGTNGGARGFAHISILPLPPAV